MDHLVGEFMGEGGKKGLAYRWIPNYLQDAHTRVVPRSFLSLVRNAADVALARGPEASHPRLLAPPELAGALEKTSQRRVAELGEEFPVVNRLEGLRGKMVMLERKEVVAALSRQPPKDEYGNDGEQVLQALFDVGAASERSDGRIDVPDIYRSAFGIKRKGGAKRLR